MSKSVQPRSIGLRYNDLPAEMRLEIIRWSLYVVEENTHWTDVLSQMATTIRCFEPRHAKQSVINIIQAHYRQEVQILSFGESSSSSLSALGSNLLYYLPNPREQFDPKKHAVGCPDDASLYHIVMLRCIIKEVTKTVERKFPTKSPGIDIYLACLTLTRFLHLSTYTNTPTPRFAFLESLPRKQLNTMLTFLEWITSELERMSIDGIRLSRDHADFITHYQDEVSSQNITWHQFAKSGGLRVCLYHYILDASPNKFWSLLGFDGTDKDVAWFHEISLWRRFIPWPTLAINRQGQHVTLRPKPGTIQTLNEIIPSRDNYWILCNRFQSDRTPRFDLAVPIPEVAQFDTWIEQPEVSELSETYKG